MVFIRINKWGIMRRTSSTSYSAALTRALNDFQSSTHEQSQSLSCSICLKRLILVAISQPDEIPTAYRLVLSLVDAAFLNEVSKSCMIEM